MELEERADGGGDGRVRDVGAARRSAAKDRRARAAEEGGGASVRLQRSHRAQLGPPPAALEDLAAQPAGELDAERGRGVRPLARRLAAAVPAARRRFDQDRRVRLGVGVRQPLGLAVGDALEHLGREIELLVDV